MQATTATLRPGRQRQVTLVEVLRVGLGVLQKLVGDAHHPNLAKSIGLVGIVPVRHDPRPCPRTSTASARRSSPGSPGSRATTRRPTSPPHASSTRTRCAASSRRCSTSWAPSSRARRACSASSATCASRPTRRRTRRAPTASCRACRGRAPASTPSCPRTASYAGSGLYQLASDQLERYRSAVDDDAKGDALAVAVAAATDAGLRIDGRSLKTAPRGYPRDHPRIELLRRRALIAGLRLAPTDEGIGRNAALAHVGDTWLAARPLTAWLDEHVGPTTLPITGRAAPRSPGGAARAA